MKASFFKIAYVIISIIIMIYTSNLCMDGWVTSSTGRGTCSHHGGQLKGVLWPFLIFGFFIFSALVDGIKKILEEEVENNLKNSETKGSIQKEMFLKANESRSIYETKNIHETKNIYETKSMNENKNIHENKNSILCPRCNSPMVIRTAKKGAYSGKNFYGCSKFPACKGIRNIEEQE